MWGGIVGLIIQLISGIAGGNVAGLALERYDLGIIGNSIAGVIGGAVRVQIIGLLLDDGEGAVVRPGGYNIACSLPNSPRVELAEAHCWSS